MFLVFFLTLFSFNSQGNLHVCCLGSVFFLGRVLAATLVAAGYEREEESSFFLPLVFISLITVMGCLKGYSILFLFLFNLS
jgi:hypothetical protein